MNRIERAYREKEKFRVIVVIPSAPGFEGDFASPDRRSMALRYLIKVSLHCTRAKYANKKQ